MALYRLGEDSPTLASDAWVAPTAQLVGKVHVGAKASIWFGVIARGDNEPLTVGEGSNVQDGSVMHSDVGYPLVIGPRVTVGHQCVLHGCTIEEGSLIGMGSTILNGAHIGKHCLVGAGSLVTEGKVFPEGSLIMGSPAKVVKALSPEQIQGLHQSALGYMENAQRFASTLVELPPTGPESKGSNHE
jgi:carbonic anhydrase/acetyltransferase-like protein (isoleucine patch superfamily)